MLLLLINQSYISYSYEFPMQFSLLPYVSNTVLTYTSSHSTIVFKANYRNWVAIKKSVSQEALDVTSSGSKDWGHLWMSLNLKCTIPLASGEVVMGLRLNIFLILHWDVLTANSWSTKKFLFPKGKTCFF